MFDDCVGQWMCSVHERFNQQAPVCLGSFKHLLGFFCIESHWFFAQNMFASCQGPECPFVMQAVG
tara:strand:- start:735 stop:929 length:195 start_codon:yes stop_codon:yes gene_type:complete